jgi:Rrf2 family protein
VRVSAKADYAIRAALELAAAGEGPVKGERIAHAQEIPPNFLENILGDLRNAGLVASRRGAEGGYWLARPAEEISLADVIRAVEGPLANVRGRPFIIYFSFDTKDWKIRFDRFFTLIR